MGHFALDRIVDNAAARGIGALINGILVTEGPGSLGKNRGHRGRLVGQTAVPLFAGDTCPLVLLVHEARCVTIGDNDRPRVILARVQAELEILPALDDGAEVEETWPVRLARVARVAHVVQSRRVYDVVGGRFGSRAAYLRFDGALLRVGRVREGKCPALFTWKQEMARFFFLEKFR